MNYALCAACTGILGLAAFEAWRLNAATSASVGDAGAARPSGFGRSIMADGLTKIGDGIHKGLTEGMTRLAVALVACTLCVCVTIAPVVRKG